jgi:hypothetical protein
VGVEGQEVGGNAVKKFFQIALGIIAAIGGFVGIGELVFNTGRVLTFATRCCGRCRSE